MLGQSLAFVLLYFEREGLKLMLPASKLSTQVRSPIDQAAAEELLQDIVGLDSTLNKNWKMRNRKSLERLDSGDPLQVAIVYKGLREIKLAKGSLNNSDRRLLDLAEELLVEELSHALGKSQEETRSNLEACSSPTRSSAA